MANLSNRIFGKDNRTYLMGASMTWIVIFHIYLWCSMSNITTPWWIELFDKGALGVDVFLLLSAYGLQFLVAFFIPLNYTSNILLITVITITLTGFITLLFSFLHKQFWLVVDKIVG